MGMTVNCAQSVPNFSTNFFKFVVAASLWGKGVGRGGGRYVIWGKGAVFERSEEELRSEELFGKMENYWEE